MSLSAEIKKQFFIAARENPDLLQKPVVKIKVETFRQILEPVKNFLRNDPLYGQYDVSTSRQVEELRKMCLEAYAAHTTEDPQEKENRTKVLNVLQSLMEKIRETENA